jgi:hypothetical protein
VLAASHFKSNLMLDFLRGSFIYTVGISSEFLFLELANNNINSNFTLWIDTPFECVTKELYNNKDLDEQEIELLALNYLRNLTVARYDLKDNDDLLLYFDDGSQLLIYGSNPDQSCYEPWRLHQTQPESKSIYIVNNK